MLIYNFQKEFIGIDEQDLKLLGFKNLEELRAESDDFADMFIRAPGLIYNFNHVHWIDFILYDDSNRDFKAIIHAKDKDYKCNLELKMVYLVDNPSRQAYLVNLLNLRALSSEEVEKLTKDIQQRVLPKAAFDKKALFEGQDLEKEPQAVPQNINEIIMQTAVANNPVTEKIDEPIKESEAESDAYPVPVIEEKLELQEDVTSDEHAQQIIEEKKIPDESNIDDNFKIDLIVDDVETYKPAQAHKPIQTPKKHEEKKIIKEDAGIENLYIYDPKVASDELGLPIDLIEEFLQDFIVQAADFKDKIYKSLDEEDISNAKSLAHKLKGVAANLHIADALEVLAVANSSNNLTEIKINIDKFYKIMSKLSIHQPSNFTAEDSKSAQTEEADMQDDDDYDHKLFIHFDNEESITPKKVDMSNQEENFVEEKVTTSIEEEVLEPYENATQYDKISVAKEIGIDNKFFNELFNDYMTDSIVLVDSIKDSIKNHNTDLWKKSAHTLKGMSDNMRVRQIIEDINILIATNDTKTAQDAVDKISTVIKQLSKI